MFENFLTQMLTRIDRTGEIFTHQAYNTISAQVLPLFKICLVIYIGYYGLQLALGLAKVSIGEIVFRIGRIVLILVFTTHWANFDILLYSWLNKVPIALGVDVLRAGAVADVEPTNSLYAIWKTASTVTNAFADKVHFFYIFPLIVSWGMMIIVLAFISISLALLILSKLMLWVLMGCAPIFISCMLFERTKELGTNWFKQVLIYALIPFFVYMIVSFLITAMNPELVELVKATGERDLKISDTYGIMLMTAASTFVMLNIQSLAQGVVGSFALAIGNMAPSMLTAGGNIPKMLMGGSKLGVKFGSKAAGLLKGLMSKANSSAGGGQGSSGSGTGTGAALQNQIRQNSMPE